MNKIIQHLLLIVIFVFTTSQIFAYSNGNPIEDSAITAAVKVKMMANPMLSSVPVTLHTKDGIVTLSGKVNSESQASELVELVQSTSGVKDIDTSHLQVAESTQALTDSLISAKIKGLFIQEKLFGSEDVAPISIHVETNNGIVYFTGIAENAEQLSNATKIANSVKGVRKVLSTVKIISSDASQ